ncbi:winged helix-turn-helix domain-containing protein [Streptomyces sp. MMG1121]|uniref:winged helix-turn-helix domain-containing protein n=1 Tax=Streptomyces sp. MMG1121 TaxID=1415544 RepID=UPI0006B02028|nr:winged helix-turn-helix domain-containing protein [Streptomyces sp. MMG1121]
MLRIDVSAQDLARIQFAARPAPLVELKLSLMMLRRPDSEQTFGRWRRGLRQRLPATTRPLRDLLSPYRGPAFLDPLSMDLPTGTSREQLSQGLHDAYSAVLGAAWPRVTALHEAEFARYALNAAERGVAGALATLCAGSRLVEGCWELDAPYQRHVVSAGRGLVLLPTFHWTMAPLIAENEGEPVLVVYPAGPGSPIVPGAAGEDALALVLGSTRAHTLRLLSDPLSTSELADRLGVSRGEASTHAAALREAGLINTVRNGRAVRHQLTALGTLLTKGAGQGNSCASHRPAVPH